MAENKQNPGKGVSGQLVEYEFQSRIEEMDGKKVTKIPILRVLQGHSFFLDASKSDEKPAHNGPFRIEYVLSNDFMVYLQNLDSLDLDAGYSNLRVAGQIAKLRRITLKYRREQSLLEGELILKVRDGLLRRLVITLPEQDLNLAIGIGGEFVAKILDSICFRKRIPLQIHQIDVHHAETGDFLRRYLMIPYEGAVDLEEGDILLALKIPKGLAPCLRLFREAISSAKPHYRLLCLYRVREGLQRLQAANDRKLKAKGITPNRMDRRVPENELTRTYFPQMVGRRLGMFLDHVRTHYRLPIAHMNLDQYERLLLDPGAVRTDHRIDYTNAVLVPMVWELVQDEWTLMEAHGLV